MDINKKKNRKPLKLTIFIIVTELVFWLLAIQFFTFFGYFASDEVGEKITFLAPENFYWLLILPFAILYFVLKYTSTTKLAGDSSRFYYLKKVRLNSTYIDYFFWRNILVFLILAMTQPSFGEKKVPIKTSGIEMVFAVDISNSMNARDMSGKSSRFEAAKRAIQQAIKHAPAAKVGMVIFAGSAYPQLPLTADKGLMKLHVNELSTDMISSQGTNISLALVQANDFFSKENFRKVVMLITDGEDHEGGVSSAFEKLKENNVETYVLGLGTEKGALVPKDPEKPSVYLKDELGRSVISNLNKNMINEIASLAETKPVISSDAYPNINLLLTQINTKKETEVVDLEFNIKQNRYYVPLWIAFILFMVYLTYVYFKVYISNAKKN